MLLMYAGSIAGQVGCSASADKDALDVPVAGIGVNPAAGSGGSVSGTGGMLSTGSDTGGSATGTGGSATGTGGTAAGTDGAATGTGGTAPDTSKLENFSFFVTSWVAMQRLSKSPNGFGGDLRYGQADGLSGADKICTEIAETSMAGAGAKGWKAFLSVVKGPKGTPVNAIDRIGAGPWYDRLGRVVAMDIAGLATKRPTGGDAEIAGDLPNEDGVKNHNPDGMEVDNHDTLTGTDNTGKLFSTDPKFTCKDWTSSVGSDGTPRVGQSWERAAGSFPGGMGGGGMADYGGWKSALTEAGCAAGASLVEMGRPNPLNPTVGSGGGYGGIFCFAQKP
jgi:hypothetical protein